jgi:hypothetical protein
VFRITFVVDQFRADATEAERALAHRTLKILLAALTQIDCEYLRAYPKTPLLYASGVRYEEEPPGQEDWQDIPTCLRLGIGDCEDLACWRAAELRVRYNVQAAPTFIWKRRPEGGYLYHIQVRYPDGRIEDPSRRLGMR